MNEYKASNGVEIRDDGSVLKWRTTTYPIWEPVGSGVPDMAGPGFARDSLIGRALAEFFLHERDEELGRWRWPENPDYVVYPGEEGDVLVYDETELDAPRYFARESSAFPGNFGAAARTYFDAHPEPDKPWEDAAQGEVWELDFVGVSNWVAVEAGDSGEPRPVFRDPHTLTEIEVDDPGITAGRRVWPEVS